MARTLTDLYKDKELPQDRHYYVKYRGFQDEVKIYLCGCYEDDFYAIDIPPFDNFILDRDRVVEVIDAIPTPEEMEHTRYEISKLWERIWEQEDD